MIKNCYFYKHNFFFYFCEEYCEQFNLTKVNFVFDGNVKEI